jgi:phosphonate transport system permease protein
VVTLIAGLLVTRFSLPALCDRDGVQGVGRILAAFFHPALPIRGRALAAIVETVYIALIATLLAIPPAFGLSFLGAGNITAGSCAGRMLYVAVRGSINFLRSVEPMIWAIIFSIWVGIGPFAGMMALMVNSIAGLVKLYSEQIENADRGVITAIASTGATPWQVVWFGVVPQIFLPFLAFSIYRWDVNVRMATVIGLVGGGGVGTLLMQYQGLAKWNEVGLIILLISLVVWAMDFLSAKIREKIF